MKSMSVFALSVLALRAQISCGCAISDPPSALKQAAAVVYAELVSKRPPMPDPTKLRTITDYKFRPIEIWKGPHVPLYTAQGLEANVSCDNYVLKPGTKYLLYLRPLPTFKGIKWPAMFNLGGCLLRLLSDEQKIAEDRRFLGVGFRPASSTADK